jgi:hypothetical protein
MGYKLLTWNMKTRQGEENETDWSDVGEWHEASGEGGLCTDGVLHDYDDPWIAVVMNPAHANIADPIMYETERAGEIFTDGLKSGCKRLRLSRQVHIPDVPLVQRVAFGVLAALQVWRNPDFGAWAENWLSGVDRSGPDAARVARAAARADADAAVAANAAANAAVRAAESADADAADAADAAHVAAYAAAASAAAAAVAATTAVYAHAAAAGGDNIDWQEIKAKAMQISD